MSASWEATHAFNRFLFVLSYFVGNCPRPIQENGEKKILSPKVPEAWHGPCLQWHGRSINRQANPQTPVSWHGPCL